MSDSGERSTTAAPRKRADARRNEQSLLDAAAEVFVTAGVQAPVRVIAARAGVGMGTIYRHFPTRADLVIAVFRHQVDACAQAGPALLADSASPSVALTRWVDLFVDFLVTKHGLAAALQSDDAQFQTLHAYFLDRLVPVCERLLEAAAAAGETRSDVDAYGLLRAIGSLCAGAAGAAGTTESAGTTGGADTTEVAGVAADSGYDARRMVHVLVAGLAVPDP